SVSFLSIAQTGVTAQPQIIIALKAKLEQFVEGDEAEGATGAKLCLHPVIVASGLGKPIFGKRRGDAAILTERTVEKLSDFFAGAGIERESSFRKTNQRTADAGTNCERRSVSEKPRCGCGDVLQVEKLAVGIFDSCIPLPRAAGDELNFRAGRSFFQIEGGWRRDRRHDGVGDIPIFVAGVEVETVTDFRIVFEGRGNFGEDAALLIVPAKK